MVSGIVPEWCYHGISSMVESFVGGLHVDLDGEDVIIAGSPRRGRFAGEIYVRLDVRSSHGHIQHLADVLLFCGRGFYRPWVEIYNVSNVVGLDGRSLELAGSRLEASILDLASSSLGPGHSLYVEYIWDQTTLREVSLGVPAPATRLGFELWRRGFMWFKVWYYPEGFMEGSEKIQAEKPVDENHARRLMVEIANELKSFISRWKGAVEVAGGALDRARAILSAVS
ncbi:MAG: DUF1122 family protein [Aeropyrum sp.]|nr:DUF1122 family protein [Aeropyrum sp.]